MSQRDLAPVIADFWEQRQRGVYFPPAWLGRLSLDEGYRVQLGLMERRVAAGGRHVGWKVGLTSEAMQRQFQVHEPVFGFMLDDAPHPSGTAFDFESLIQPGVEVELCLVLGEDLVGPGIDAAAARAAVAAVYPALEIAETRGDFTAYLSVALAENIQQKYIVLGPETRPLPPDLDLAAVQARVTMNDTEVAAASGAAVLGDPLHSVAWLANKLPEYGQRLRAGQLVMSGSLTRQFALARGDRVLAHFEPLGAVSASFV